MAEGYTQPRTYAQSHIPDLMMTESCPQKLTRGSVCLPRSMELHLIREEHTFQFIQEWDTCSNQNKEVLQPKQPSVQSHAYQCPSQGNSFPWTQNQSLNLPIYQSIYFYLTSLENKLVFCFLWACIVLCG